MIRIQIGWVIYRMIENINWFPGHMKKTEELIRTNLKLVDIIIEVIDARIPIASRNPIIDNLIGNKPRIIAINKTDLANATENKKWEEYFKNQGNMCILLNSSSGTGVKKLLTMLSEYKDKKDREYAENREDKKQLAIKKPLRMMIVGIPNVGKSSLINKLVGKKSAQTGDRPGVTRGKQWLTLVNGMQLLDTPGILWHKFEDPEVGLKLAFCGSIKDETMDIPSLALDLIELLREDNSQGLMERYKLEELGESPLETMENIAKKRGFIFSGKRIDYERTGKTVLGEFRATEIGKITLEKAEELL